MNNMNNLTITKILFAIIMQEVVISIIKIMNIGMVVNVYFAFIVLLLLLYTYVIAIVA